MTIFIKSMYARRLSAGISLLALLLLSPTPVAALGGAIAQGYQTNSNSIGTGVVVSLVATGSNVVEPATTSNAANLIGVAVEKPIIQLSEGNKNMVQVAVGGTANVLVSDANGTVRAGDKISVSPLAGIGMKAVESGEVIGTAQQPLSSVTTITEQVKETNGKSVPVHVGLIPVAVSVGYYSAATTSGTVSAFVPPFLQNIANAVAGKTVSPLRVLIAVLALLLGFFAAVLMLYVGVRSGVISLGRNPLAADALRRGMIDVLIGALGVLLITGVVVGAVILT